jgi:hypothetical protein
LKSSRFFGLLKTAKAPENKGFFRFMLKEQKARRNPPGPIGPNFTDFIALGVTLNQLAADAQIDPQV